MTTAQWRQIERTVLRVELPGQLPLAVYGGTAVPGGPDLEFPFAGTVHVLTTYRRGAAAFDEPLDVDRQDRLEQQLLDTGQPLWYAENWPREGRIGVPSFAVAGLDRDAAAHLGRVYGQLALFELVPGEFRVVPCEDNGAVRVRSLHVRAGRAAPWHPLPS